jgi:hypothetical protein
VCIAIGYVAGTLINTSREDKKPIAENVELAPDTLITGHLEVARFLRDKPGNPIQAVVDGKLISRAEALSTSQREHLESLILELRTWLGLSVPQPQELLMSDAEPAQLPALKPAGVYSASPAPSAGVPAAPVIPPFIESKSIVSQIDDILQVHLETSPYSNKSIRLIESPNKGVVVVVGLEQFPGIDEVPDAGVRTMIREAVSEWELKAK